MSQSRILLYDIETSPLLSYTWSRWQQGVIDVESEWYILCFSWKWLGDRKVQYCGLDDFPQRLQKNPEDDSHVCKTLRDLFDAADIVIAHNGDKFDRRKANTRFLYHGLMPPSPVHSIDTLKIAKRHFAFSSNRLDELGKFLRVGRKSKHNGFQTWRGCMMGEESAWKKMKRYARQDVALLEEIYYALRPWMESHPNLNLFESDGGCPKCGSSNLISKGMRALRTGLYQRFRCNDCGGWCRSRKQNRGSSVDIVN